MENRAMGVFETLGASTGARWDTRGWLSELSTLNDPVAGLWSRISQLQKETTNFHVTKAVTTA
jgi:hypothetical protein